MTYSPDDIIRMLASLPTETFSRAHLQKGEDYVKVSDIISLLEKLKGDSNRCTECGKVYTKSEISRADFCSTDCRDKWEERVQDFADSLWEALS